MTDEQNLMDELREVDRLLPELAQETPPPALVADLLERIAAETPLSETSPAPRRRRTPRPPTWLAVAALLVVGAGITLAMTLTQGGKVRGLFETADLAALDTAVAMSEPMPPARVASSAPVDQQTEIRERIRERVEEERLELATEAGVRPAEIPRSIAITTPGRLGPPAVVDPWTSDKNADTAEVPGFNRDSYAHTPDNPWMRVQDDPLSTFSVDVDTASYSNVRRILREGGTPAASAVRIEELLNYFDYDYPVPALDADPPFTVTAQVGPAPWAPEHRLVHIGLQAAALADDEVPARNLVFLVDVSGSMKANDKLPLLKHGLTLLARDLRAEDTVAIVVYAGAAGVVLEPTSGLESDRIEAALSRLHAGGSTHGSAGIKLAYELAREHFVEDGVNRVILASDGDFNVGTSSQGELVELIEHERESGVFLTVLGFGRGNLADDRMESLADHGNGNYAYIDSLSEAHRVLVQESSSTLVTVAKDVKIQVEFNPEEVAGYRLIGYTNRQLEHRDFTDDTKDAGEVGAGHSVTALYEVVLAGEDVAVPEGTELRYQKPNKPSKAAASGELVTVRLRWKDPQGSKSRAGDFAVTDSGRGLAATSDDFRFSAAVAGWGMLLRGSPEVGDWTLRDASRLADDARGDDSGGWRRELVELIELSRR